MLTRSYMSAVLNSPLPLFQPSTLCEQPYVVGVNPCGLSYNGPCSKNVKCVVNIPSVETEAKV
jgi:hypothetical protein